MINLWLTDQELDGMTLLIRAEARKAVELGNSVLSKAQETLQILQDFDSKVEENRADFEAIMEETNAIEVLCFVSHHTAEKPTSQY